MKISLAIYIHNALGGVSTSVLFIEPGLALKWLLSLTGCTIELFGGGGSYICIQHNTCFIIVCTLHSLSSILRTI